jgi:hypothetical protein
MITITDDSSWAAEGPDLFKALRELRRMLDPQGIPVGVNGARRDAWASGMQCDMGEGRFVCLLAGGEAGRPAEVGTLGPTSLEDVGTVDDQDEHFARWLDSRRTINWMGQGRYAADEDGGNGLITARMGPWRIQASGLIKKPPCRRHERGFGVSVGSPIRLTDWAADVRASPLFMRWRKVKN